MGLIDRVHFVGSVGSVGSTAPLYEQFDLFLLTSWYESSSLAVMEAMASGCAVIATDGSGVKWLLEDQVSGLMDQPKAVNQIAGLVETLLADEEQRIRIGTAAQHPMLSELQGQVTLIARCTALEAKSLEVEQELKEQQRHAQRL